MFFIVISYMWTPPIEVVFIFIIDTMFTCFNVVHDYDNNIGSKYFLAFDCMQVVITTIANLHKQIMLGISYSIM